MAPVTIELEAEREVDPRRVDERAPAVREPKGVLAHERRKSGSVDESDERSFQHRVRGDERTLIEDDSHRPDTVATLSADRTVAIGHHRTFRDLVAFGTVERVLDSLEAA